MRQMVLGEVGDGIADYVPPVVERFAQESIEGRIKLACEWAADPDKQERYDLCMGWLWETDPVMWGVVVEIAARYWVV